MPSFIERIAKPCSSSSSSSSASAPVSTESGHIPSPVCGLSSSLSAGALLSAGAHRSPPAAAPYERGLEGKRGSCMEMQGVSVTEQSRLPVAGKHAQCRRRRGYGQHQPAVAGRGAQLPTARRLSAGEGVGASQPHLARQAEGSARSREMQGRCDRGAKDAREMRCEVRRKGSEASLTCHGKRAVPSPSRHTSLVVLSS